MDWLWWNVGSEDEVSDHLRADLFMSKLTSRLPNLGYFGHEVKSRVNLCRIYSRKTNPSLLIRELNLVHITTPWIKRFDWQ